MISWSSVFKTQVSMVFPHGKPLQKIIHPVPNSALRPSRTGGDSQKAHGQLWEVESEPGTLGELMGNWWDFAVVSTLLFLLNTALEHGWNWLVYEWFADINKRSFSIATLNYTRVCSMMSFDIIHLPLSIRNVFVTGILGNGTLKSPGVNLVIINVTHFQENNSKYPLIMKHIAMDSSLSPFLYRWYYLIKHIEQMWCSIAMSAMSRNEAGYTQPTALASNHPRSAGSPRMFPLVSWRIVWKKTQDLSMATVPQMHGICWEVMSLWCKFRRVLFFPVLKLTFFAVFHYLFGQISESFTNLFKSSGHLGCFPEASEASHHQIDVVNVSIDPSRPLVHQDQPGEGGQREGQRGLALKSRWNGEMLDEKLRNDNFGLTMWQQCDNIYRRKYTSRRKLYIHCICSHSVNMPPSTTGQQDGVPVFQQNHTSLPGRVNINLSGSLTASAIPKMFWLGRCSTIMPNNYNTNYNH